MSSTRDTDPSEESLARAVGYISAADTYSSLKPELIRIIQSEHRGDAYEEFRKMERRNYRKWLNMDHTLDPERLSDSVVTEVDPARNVSEEKGKAKSVVSERSASSKNLDAGSQSSEGVDRVLLKKEVGAWWGIKCPD